MELILHIMLVMILVGTSTIGKVQLQLMRRNLLVARSMRTNLILSLIYWTILLTYDKILIFNNSSRVSRIMSLLISLIKTITIEVQIVQQRRVH